MPSVSLPQSFLDKAMEIAQNKAVRIFKHIGEACVQEAVENGNYTDHTGNLRSSIGFVVAKDGEVVEEGGFWHIGNGDTGVAEGRSLAVSKASGTSGVTLVLVAGMSYAKRVADLGYNVLDSAEIVAKQMVAELKR